MRAIDKWLGIPVCFLLSLMEFFLKPFPRKEDRPVKKILFLQISEMGSSLSAYSSILKARELFPGVEIYYFIFQEMQDSIHLMDVVKQNHVYTVSSKSFLRFTKGIFKMIWLMRAQKFDAILDLELFSRLSSILCYLFGAKNRVGFNGFHMEGLYRGTLQTQRVIYNHTRHISFNFLALVYALKEDRWALPLPKLSIPKSDIKSLKIRSTSADKKAIRDKLLGENVHLTQNTKIVLLNPNASDLLPLRRWPTENYIETAIRLLKDKDHIVILIGVQSEYERASKICEAVNSDRCFNFAGKTTLRELIDLFNTADIFLSNDSGPPNFASLTDIPTFVFFGPETPLCYKPLGKNIEALYANFHCSPCVSAYNHRKSACTDNKCLQVITVDEVYEKMIVRLR
jgi:ADP-heptose:LPS heptosyltransferase